MSDRQHRRQFLNATDGLAAFEWHVDIGDKKDSVEAQFEISDCNRTVVLEFGSYSLEQVEEARTKVTRLRRGLLAFERALLDALESVEGNRVDD